MVAEHSNIRFKGKLWTKNGVATVAAGVAENSSHSVHVTINHLSTIFNCHLKH